MTKQQRKECNKIIHTASVVAGGVGTGVFGIPWGDKMLITPIQVMMAIKLAKVFDIDLTESTSTIALLTSGVVSTFGRTVAGMAIRRISISECVIKTSTAAAITEVLGWTIANEFDSGNIVEKILLVKDAVEGDNESQQDKHIENDMDVEQLEDSCPQKENGQQRKGILFYPVGSIITLGISSLIIPKLSRKVANSIYKINVKKQNEKDNNWGPEIIKKNKDWRESGNGN